MTVGIEKAAVRFMIGFEDADLTVPIVRTIRFLRSQKSDSGESVLLFEEIRSAMTREKVFVRESDFEEFVLDKERLLDTLHHCFAGDLASRRP